MIELQKHPICQLSMLKSITYPCATSQFFQTRKRSLMRMREILVLCADFDINVITRVCFLLSTVYAPDTTMVMDSVVYLNVIMKSFRWKHLLKFPSQKIYHRYFHLMNDTSSLVIYDYFKHLCDIIYCSG